MVVYGRIVLQDLTLGFIDTDPIATDGEGMDFDLFRRLSRTPGLRQKERFCVEVLASVLSCAPTIRRGFVCKLAEITEWQVPEDLEQCQIILETERVIRDAKRIDLTVEIVRRSDNGLERLAGWAFEAKVDSGINESLDCDGDEEKRLRNQLDFYSEWIDEFRAEHKAGFVLGKSELLTGGIKHQKALFGRVRRSVLWGTISDGHYPIIMVGVRSAYIPLLFIVIETEPRHPAKNHVKSTLDGTESKLNDLSQKRRGTDDNWPETKWCVDPEPEWWDLEANWPLQQLLSADDQTNKVRRLVSDALAVLSESGVVGKLRRLQFH